METPRNKGDSSKEIALQKRREFTENTPLLIVHSVLGETESPGNTVIARGRARYTQQQREEFRSKLIQLVEFHETSGGKYLERDLKGLQDERKIEQTFIGMSLATWFLVCAPLITGSTIILGSGGLPSNAKGVATFVLLGAASGASCFFHYVLRGSIDALNFRHITFRTLTNAFEAYVSWSFWWREEADQSETAHALWFRTIQRVVSYARFFFLACAIAAGAIGIFWPDLISLKEKV